jgi:hypothetical protein
MCAAHLILTVPAGRVFPIDRLMGHHRHFGLPALCAAARGRIRAERAWRWGFPFHTLYKYLINAFPQASVQRFSSGSYSPPTVRWPPSSRGFLSELTQRRHAARPPRARLMARRATPAAMSGAPGAAPRLVAVVTLVAVLGSRRIERDIRYDEGVYVAIGQPSPPIRYRNPILPGSPPQAHIRRPSRSCSARSRCCRSFR